MPIRSRNIRTSATASGAPIVELIASAVKGCKIREIGIIIVNATASTFGLGVPAAKGVTPTTPVPLLDMAQGDSGAAGATLAVAWGTPPTIPAAFFRQCSLPATAGAALNPTWRFNKLEYGNGLFVPAGTSIILWSLTTVSIADVFFTVEEP
jgi:hypothetical protein